MRGRLVVLQVTHRAQGAEVAWGVVAGVLVKVGDGQGEALGLFIHAAITIRYCGLSVPTARSFKVEQIINKQTPLHPRLTAGSTALLAVPPSSVLHSGGDLRPVGGI